MEREDAQLGPQVRWPLAGAGVGALLFTAPWWPVCWRPSTSATIGLLGLFLTVACLLLAGLVWLARRGPAARANLGYWAAVIGIGGALAAWLAIPNLLGAVDRGAQKRTMENLRAVGLALEEYSVRTNRYPLLDGTAEDLQRALVLKPGAVLPATDGWRHPIRVHSTPDHYVVMSFGCCGQPDVPDPARYVAGPTSGYQDDIVFADGQFLRYPDGSQR